MTLVGLEYLKHQEQARANRAQETNKRSEMLLNYDTSTRDRAAKANIAGADRASRENVASLDRLSKERIESAKIGSNERISAANRALDWQKFYNNYAQTAEIEGKRLGLDKYKFDNSLQKDYDFKNADIDLKERELTDREKQTRLKALEGDLKRIQTEIQAARYGLDSREFDFEQDKWADENFRKWFQMLPKALGELIPG